MHVKAEDVQPTAETTDRVEITEAGTKAELTTSNPDGNIFSWP